MLRLNGTARDHLWIYKSALNVCFVPKADIQVRALNEMLETILLKKNASNPINQYNRFILLVF